MFKLNWAVALAAANLFLLLVVVLQLPHAAKAQQWRLGRATYFGAPEAFSEAFDPVRGEGSFGILTYGSCGFTNSDGSLPFPRDAVAAAADANPDYPGSCGRCYAVRCKEGFVLSNAGSPQSINDSTILYLPSVTRTLRDTQGRAWPGNQAEAQGRLFTKCQTPRKEIVVRVIDTCPCRQVLQDGAPGVKAGGEIRRQDVCCGGPAGIAHFDLSYWVFEQLAHPLFGRMMLEFRPVDCDTGVPLTTYEPGYISKTDIYRGGTKAGWNWFPYSASYSRYAVPGQAPDGAAATCVQLTEGGGLSFHVKQGFLPGYQPFAGVKAVQVWLKSDASTDDTQLTSTPRGEPVDVKVFIFNFEFQKYCNSELRTGNYTPSATAGGGWFQHTIPFADFKCDYEGALPTQVDRIDFQNISELPALFCLAGLRLVR